ncbi:DUF1254 domain-containing protein [Sinorhizobium meliloti]|nr:DUF1254 domain-containing protein [Sinorhizobium meliloti]MCO5960899.1 DUF1254 domain-containing protein [Sinorhizobium meliloti]
MRRFARTTLTAALLYSVAGIGAHAQETPDELDTRIGKLTFESGYPSKETVAKLYDEMDFQRASQAYLWGIPAVGLNEWRKAHFNVFKAKNGEMLSYLDFAEKLGILTPNYTTPYIATFIDLKESGPMVVVVPPGLIAGMVLDQWQRVMADLGVVGPDMGKGGKYLILPPGYGGGRGILCHPIHEPGRAGGVPPARCRQGKGNCRTHPADQDLHLDA